MKGARIHEFYKYHYFIPFCSNCPGFFQDISANLSLNLSEIKAQDPHLSAISEFTASLPSSNQFPAPYSQSALLHNRLYSRTAIAGQLISTSVVGSARDPSMTRRVPPDNRWWLGRDSAHAHRHLPWFRLNKHTSATFPHCRVEYRWSGDTNKPIDHAAGGRGTRDLTRRPGGRLDGGLLRSDSVFRLRHAAGNLKIPVCRRVEKVKKSDPAFFDDSIRLCDNGWNCVFEIWPNQRCGTNTVNL